MTAADIAEAVAALDEASVALNTGLLNIREQMDMARRCYVAARPLRKALEKLEVVEAP